MTRSRLFRIAALAALLTGAGVPAAAVAAAPASAATTTYTITDLGSLGGGVTVATAINTSGQVTGYSYLPKKQGATVYHAFLWTNGKMTDLGELGGAGSPGGGLSEGHAINDAGQVVGYATDTAGDLDAALWNGRKITLLPGLNPDAIGINDSGQIIGVINGEFIDSNGTQTVLPDPPSLLTCNAVAINNNGQVTGDCSGQEGTLNEFTPRGVVWTNDTPTVLPTLGGPCPSAALTCPEAFPTAINNNGQVTGTAATSTGALDGFLWSNGTITDLGPDFAPAAINDNGVIVGGAFDVNGVIDGGGFIDTDGTLQNLNTLIPAGSGFQIQSATGINDNGQIIANATDTATGQQHALLLTPN